MPSSRRASRSWATAGSILPSGCRGAPTTRSETDGTGSSRCDTMPCRPPPRRMPRTAPCRVARRLSTPSTAARRRRRCAAHARCTR
eukprot:1298594-Prymnesium_polylepis.1